MSKKIIQLLLICLIICVIGPLVRADELLEYGYYVGDKHIYPEVPRISAFEAKKLYDQGKLILINPMAEHKRLLGAINISIDKIKNTDMTLPHNVIVAFYCS
ncbi:MAG: hypothetical protein A2Y81_04435 [Nitrospirae bacterium RBG_13_43_8]|nr:MAG: hypothetical protein A2Y81_04435 [Nitrospirae bacterium RBG_13_43_8]